MSEDYFPHHFLFLSCFSCVFTILLKLFDFTGINYVVRNVNEGGGIRYSMLMRQAADACLKTFDTFTDLLSKVKMKTGLLVYC